MHPLFHALGESFEETARVKTGKWASNHMLHLWLLRSTNGIHCCFSRQSPAMKMKFCDWIFRFIERATNPQVEANLTFPWGEDTKQQRLAHLHKSYATSLDRSVEAQILPVSGKLFKKYYLSTKATCFNANLRDRGLITNNGSKTCGCLVCCCR